MKRFILLAFIFSLTQIANARALRPYEKIMVTAATSQIGQVICDDLASRGYQLILAGRSPQKLADLEARLKENHVSIEVSSIIIDFEDIKSIENAAKKIPPNSLTGIVLIGPRPNLSKDNIPNKAEWNKAFSETFFGPLEVLRLFSNHIQKNGSIVIMNGLTSKIYMPSYPNTNVIRMAWSGEVKNLAHFFGQRKIKVNAVSPGILLTEFNVSKIKERAAKNNISYEKQLEKETSSIALKSYGAPQDAADLVAFLLSQDSRHLSGVNIPLDGGESNAY